MWHLHRQAAEIAPNYTDGCLPSSQVHCSSCARRTAMILGSARTLATMLTTVCGTGCSWFAAWSPVARKALPHASGKPCSGTRGNLLSWPRTGVPPLLRAEAAGFDSQMGRPSGQTSTTRRKVRQPLADARTRPLPMHCSRTDSVCPFHCCRLLSRGEFRVRRLSVVQAKRACLDALVMCCAWIAAVVERVENARSIAIVSLTGTLGRPHTGPGWPRVTCMGHGDPLVS